MTENYDAWLANEGWKGFYLRCCVCDCALGNEFSPEYREIGDYYEYYVCENCNYGMVYLNCIPNVDLGEFMPSAMIPCDYCGKPFNPDRGGYTEWSVVVFSYTSKVCQQCCDKEEQGND